MEHGGDADAGAEMLGITLSYVAPGAPAYVFLASAHCSSYIRGEILPIIGGYSNASQTNENYFPNSA
jgi:hypothetical protein